MTRSSFLHAAAGAIGAAALARAASEGVAHPDLSDVFPVPPLARRNDSKRSFNMPENDRLFRFLTQNGIKRVVYGGNALVYHLTHAEYSELIEWLSGLTSQASIIPAVGPEYGQAKDQAAIARKGRFESLLVLPTNAPRDAAGLEAGLREVAETAGLPLSLYVKDELNFGSDKEAGLDTIAHLVDSKVCVSIKYAVVRKNPAEDPYLRSLLKRVDPSRIVSGIGERPAIVHLQQFKLAGFTTGSGVLAPKRCLDLLHACKGQQWEKAEAIRQTFLPLEDLRDQWGPPQVLHHAVAAAGIADTGPLPPYLSGLTKARVAQLTPVAKELFHQNHES